MNIARVLFIVLFPLILIGQVVTVSPAFPKATDEVTITFDATKGTAGLKNCNCDIYLHTGVITDKSTSNSDWKHVVTSWGQANTAWKMTRVAGESNLYTYKISPSIKSYYGVGNNEDIKKMAFVFRNADGSKEGKDDGGKDIFIDVYPENAGFSMSLTNPTKKDFIVKQYSLFPINIVVSEQANISVFQDGVFLSSELTTEMNITIDATVVGTHTIDIRAIKDSDTLKTSFNYTVPKNNVIKNLNAEIEDGITIKNDSIVIFTLYAPQKKHVFAIGDFNDWKINTDFQLNMTPDGKRWWIEITGLKQDEEYGFQYLVDGELKIADPYSNIILDPWNDKYISDEVFPDLMPYPTNKTEGIVSLITTGYDGFSWEYFNYEKPKKEKLIIYEILLRDFLKDHSFQSLTDTLDYFERLGINAIELMPVNEFEGNESWGYNPSFHYALDKYYGDPIAFKTFVQEAHRRGIAVILDVVFNHAFSQCPLAQLYWDDAKFRPSAINPWLNQEAKHPFNVGYDFNHESNATKYYVKKVLKHWMIEYQVDGFRFDLSKGFTQHKSTNNSQMAAYDASRIAILKDYADHIWNIDNSAYVILEHFATNTEEKELSNYGMMLWGNMNHEYNEASMGYNSNLSYVTHKQRGWNKPHLVGYMESHDEERTMFKNLKWGNANGSYSVKNLRIALLRQELTGAFFFLLPGPKIIWEFGELGYDYSINTCKNGSINDNCRLDPKPIRWDYQTTKERKTLYNIWSQLIKLKKGNDIFNTTNFTYKLNTYQKSIHLNSDNGNVTIIGNFDVKSSSINPQFQHTGWWFDYFSGDSIYVNSTILPMDLSAGEYHIYSDKRLNQTTSSEEYTNTSEVFSIFPNPVQDEMTLSINSKKIQEVTIEIIDITGKYISKHHRKLKQNNNKIIIKTKILNQGIFIIKIPELGIAEKIIAF